MLMNGPDLTTRSGAMMLSPSNQQQCNVHYRVF